eukprot:1158307-Pelagomonas_calceolata.AAC.8
MSLLHLRFCPITLLPFVAAVVIGTQMDASLIEEQIILPVGGDWKGLGGGFREGVVGLAQVTHARVHARTHTHTRMHAHTHARAHTHTHTHTHARTHARTHAPHAAAAAAVAAASAWLCH